VKKNQDTAAQFFKSSRNTTSALRLPQTVFWAKAISSLDIFRFLKANYEKLPIIYANIRV
jgi:hypothetical protein